MPCALYRSGDSPPALSEVEQARNKTTALLAALRDYARALVAVTTFGNPADRSGGPISQQSQLFAAKAVDYVGARFKTNDRAAFG